MKLRKVQGINERTRWAGICLVVGLAIVITGCAIFGQPKNQAAKHIDIYVEDYNWLSEIWLEAKVHYDEAFYYEGSKQLPKEIVEQFRIYVDYREIWFDEMIEDWSPTCSYYYYTLNDLNLDGSLELICSCYGGTGKYSRSYIYTINSSRKVICVADIDGGVSPDFLWGMELYSDISKDGQVPEHFYIRANDNTPDERFYYRRDMVVTFNSDFTEWNIEWLRDCTEEYQDVTHSDLVNVNYYNAERAQISKKEWQRLEDEFLKDKEFITLDFEWDTLCTYSYDSGSVEVRLTNRELGEALEELYEAWQFLLVEVW